MLASLRQVSLFKNRKYVRILNLLLQIAYFTCFFLHYIVVMFADPKQKGYHIVAMDLENLRAKEGLFLGRCDRDDMTSVQMEVAYNIYHFKN